MSDELDLYFRENYTPEMYALFKQSFELFDRIQLEDYEDEYVALLMESNTMDKDTLEAAVYAATMNNVVYVIQQHGIKLTADVTLALALSILEGLLDLQDYTDKVTIQRILETTSTNEEQFCELINLVSNRSVVTLLTAIDEVPFTLLDLMAKELVEDEQEQRDDETTKQKIVKQIKQLRSFYKNEDTAAFLSMRGNIPVGLQFTFYLQRSKDVLEGDDLETVAKELLAMLCLSADYQDPLSKFRSNSESIIDDFAKITKLDIILNRLWLEFTKFNRVDTVSQTNVVIPSIPLESKQ